MFTIDKPDCWETPEGAFSAVYRETRVIEKMNGNKLETIIRPVFELTSLTSRRCKYVVSKNYKASEPQKLQADLHDWLGDAFFDLADQHGKVTREGLDSLIGKAADLRITHIPNEGHKAPFSHLVQLAPPGTLIN